MDDARLRRDLIELLEGGHAHVTPEQAFGGLKPALRAARPKGAPHSVWQLLEHMRLAQEDILRYTLESGWRSPKWPEGYWPSVAEPTPAQWKASLAGFDRDLEAVRTLVRDRARDLTAEIPHGEGRSYLRQVLLVADHNSYHLGQVVAVRRRLEAWKSR
jgi:uncharacterized damage-inducible protein DinB